ncbi:hypothetical protein H6768_06080 [Candidatus Peribacteria bacterium]|nr:hypothetical protein [Candidatus Peribacteria bacterium]
MKILDMDIDIQEVAFSGDLVRDIEHLLPVQRCNNLEDFQTLVSLYSPDGWECTSPAWQEVVHKYF